MSEYAGKRVLVLGLGVSGFASAKALIALDAKVRVSDAREGPEVSSRAAQLMEAGAEVELGGHDLDRLDCDLVVVSPGIPPSAPVMVALRQAGIEIIGEIEFAYQRARCDFLAVTGTNGKTTTTALLASMLSEGGVRSQAAGNIGAPAIEAVTEIGAGGAIALEVSSFQLATISSFRPKVAVVLNVADDHLDWHGGFEAYARDKERITLNQVEDDSLLLNAEDPTAAAMGERASARVVPFSALRSPEGGIGVLGGVVVWRGQEIFSVEDCLLSGRAGLEDAVAAAGAALEYGIDPRAVRRAVKGFVPLGHRLEVVAEVDGVTFINDSKSTNPHATLAAVSGMDDVVLIAGGRAKGIDLSPLIDAVPPVSAVIAMGEAAEEVERVFHPKVPVERAADMDEAVRRAQAHSVRGGAVLLSPGCASLDMYENYMERGEAFTDAVKALIAREGDTGGDA